MVRRLALSCDDSFEGLAQAVTSAVHLDRFQRSMNDSVLKSIDGPISDLDDHCLLSRTCRLPDRQRVSHSILERVGSRRVIMISTRSRRRAIWSWITSRIVYCLPSSCCHFLTSALSGFAYVRRGVFSGRTAIRATLLPRWKQSQRPLLPTRASK